MNTYRINNTFIAGNTNDSTSTSTGSTQIFGGMAVAKSIYGGMTGSFDTVIVRATTQSTSSATGALTVGGGIGCGKDLYVGAGSVAKKKLVLLDWNGDACQFFGMGIQPYEYRFQVGNIADHFGFYSALSATTEQEVFRIEGGLAANPAVKVFATTASSSTNSGALVVTGGVGIGAGGLTVGSLIYTTNNFQSALLGGSGNRALYSDPNGYITNSSSDSRLKEDVVNLSYSLNEIKQLRPVSFHWIDREKRGEQKEIGLIAQEVLSIIPEVVGVLINGVKEQATTISSLQQTVSSQASQLTEQQATITSLSTTISSLISRITALET